MAMLTVNGAAAPAPSAMKVTVFDVSSGASRNAAGNAVMDRSAVKRRLELAWPHLGSDELAALLQATDGFFEVAYPDPESGGVRSMQCYCSDRSAEIMRMSGGTPVWTGVKMIWTER